MLLVDGLMRHHNKLKYSEIVALNKLKANALEGTSDRDAAISVFELNEMSIVDAEKLSNSDIKILISKIRTLSGRGTSGGYCQ